MPSFKTLSPTDYLDAAAVHCRKYAGHSPNFLMSQYWMTMQGYWVRGTHSPEGRPVIQVVKKGLPILPTIYMDDYSVDDGPCEAGFATGDSVDSLWDRQYVYTPSLILDGWQGGQFRGRRKALSLALRNLGADLSDCQMVRWDRDRDGPATQDYLAAWAEGKGDGVYDPDLLVEAMLGDSLEYNSNSAGKASLLVRGRTMGVATIDRGIPGWVNFRYCLVAPNIPGLSELCRMMTWQTIATQYPDIRFINDGGCLDSPGLEQFKDKLCPAYKLFVPTKE